MRRLLLLACVVLMLILLQCWNLLRDVDACEQKAAQVESQFAFNYWSGCKLLMNGQWIDGDRVVVSHGMVYVRYEGVPA